MNTSDTNNDTPPRGEGTDASVCAPTPHRYDFTLRCDTPPHFCECPDGACECHNPTFLKYLPPPTGTLYQGCGVCRTVA